MLDHRKQAVSIRLGESDLRSIKLMAQRLGVRDSDIMRFAIKSMLDRNSPLCDHAITGRSLVPVFVEFGDELIRYLELDAYRLESIINLGADDDARVERDDIALLAMNGLRNQYLLMRIRGTGEYPLDEGRSLRGYLYEKYVYRNGEPKHKDVPKEAENESRSGAQRPAA